MRFGHKTFCVGILVEFSPINLSEGHFFLLNKAIQE